MYNSKNERSNVYVCIHFSSIRPQWRSVKKNRPFPVKKKKLFERSEFFFFREKTDFLASEVQPANFFCFVFFVRAKKMKSPCGLSTKDIR